jgi:hypothetical protein
MAQRWQHHERLRRLFDDQTDLTAPEWRQGIDPERRTNAQDRRAELRQKSFGRRATDRPAGDFDDDVSGE